MADQITAYQAYRNRVVDGSIPSLGTTNFSPENQTELIGDVNQTLNVDNQSPRFLFKFAK